MLTKEINIRKVTAFFLSILMAFAVVLGTSVKTFAVTRKYFVPKTLKISETGSTGTTSYDQRFQRVDSIDFDEERLFMALANESTDSSNNRLLADLIDSTESLFANDSIRFGKIQEIDFYESTSDNTGKELTSKHFFKTKDNRVVSQTISDRKDYGGSAIYNYSYNSKGDLVQVTDQDVTNFGYSSLEKTNISYDSKGRISKITTIYENSDGEKSTTNLTFSSYNQDGLPTMDSGKNKWSLNKNNQVTKLVFDYPSNDMYNEYTYDNNGHLTKIAYYSVDQEGKRVGPDYTTYSDYYAI